MTRISFLKSLFAPLLIPFTAVAVKKTETEIERLEEDYYEASVALIRYKERHGFEEGARVRAQCRSKDEPVFGMIVPNSSNPYADFPVHIVIRKDDGRTQPWPMSQLTVISKESDE